MSESEIVLPLDETIWDYVDKMEGSIGIQITEDKALDLLGALYDIWNCTRDNPQQAGELVIGLAALLVAAPLEQADKVWQELIVNENMKNFELSVKELLDYEDGTDDPQGE